MLKTRPVTLAKLTYRTLQDSPLGHVILTHTRAGIPARIVSATIGCDVELQLTGRPPLRCHYQSHREALRFLRAN